MVDRLNVAADVRNREVWASRIAAGRKTKIIWNINNRRWKAALYAALR
ncbi:MAG TPA: hypothetical protein VEI54_11420 [Candidatus Limnocylindrales bacterium]|nr:hypothetical protein [Candidatus Limnocylindrales bacterium]